MTALDFFDKCNDMMQSIALDRISSFGGPKLSDNRQETENASTNTGIEEGFVDEFLEPEGATDAEFADDSEFDFADDVIEDDDFADGVSGGDGGSNTNTLDEFSFESVKLCVDKETASNIAHTAENLAMDFINFLTEQGYLVDSAGSPCDNWNSNFEISAATDAEALKLYVLMHYGVDVSLNAIELYQNCLAGDVLGAVGRSKRELGSEDVALLLRNYENDWFDEDVFNSFSIEPRDSALLLQVMSDGKVDLRALHRYSSVSADALFAYLELVSKDNFNAQLFDTQIENGVDVIKYVSRVESGDLESISLISNRDDIAEITELLNACEDAGYKVPVTLLNEYASVPCLGTILRAYGKGIFNKRFIDEVLLYDKMNAAKFVYTLYEEGKIDFSVYKECGDVFFAILTSDANQKGLTSVEELRSVMQGHRTAVLLLLKAVYQRQYPLNSFDYAKFLTVLCSKYGAKVAEWIEQGYLLDSLNSFCASVVAGMVGSSTKIPSGIDRSLFLSRNEAVAVHSVEEIIFNDSLLDGVCDGTECSLVVLPENKGLIVGDADGVSKEYYSVHKFGRTSLDSAVLAGIQQRMLDSGRLERCNVELLKQSLAKMNPSGGCVFTQYVQGVMDCDNKTLYGLYDTTFGFIVEYFPELVLLLCAENSKYYLQLIKMLSGVTDKHKFMYQLLFYVLRAKYGKQFVCKCMNLGNLSPLTSGVVVYGLKNLTYITYRDLLGGIDALFDIASGKSGCTLDIAHGKTTIRFR